MNIDEKVDRVKRSVRTEEQREVANRYEILAKRWELNKLNFIDKVLRRSNVKHDVYS